MRLKRFHRGRSIVLLATALCGLRGPSAFALRNNPNVVEAGDRGSIVFPIENDPESEGPLKQVKVEITDAPPWLNLLPISLLGPQDIFPGRKFSFHIDFEVGANFTPANAKVNMSVKIVQASTDVIPSQWNCVVLRLKTGQV